MEASEHDAPGMTEDHGTRRLMLSRYGTYIEIGSAGQQTAYRFLCDDGAYLWMMKLGEQTKQGIRLHAAPKTSKLRVRWKAAYARQLNRTGRLHHVAERGIPPEMPAEPIPDGSSPELDRKRSLVTYIRAYWGDSVITDKAAYAEAIQHAVDIYDVAAPTARKWLEMHLFYGEHPNATMKQDWRKGGPGVSRRGLRDESGKYVTNLGRPNDNERLNANTRHKRRRLYPSFAASWERFIRVQAWENDDPITVILDRFKITRVGYTRALDGATKAYPVDPKHMPEDANMLRHGRPILKSARHERDEARKYEAGRRRQLSGGSSRDLVDEELSVLDIDATPADIYLRYGGEAIFVDGVGKPTVFIASDRGSDAIVGWYVTFGTENGDGYKSCIFSAYTPKERELRKWSVPNLDGMVYGCASQIFIDRGPGISKKTQEAVVARLRTDSLMARPGDPRGKGLVERLMRYVQDEVARIPGSTRALGNPDADRRRRMNAKKNALLTFELFMRALLTAISKWNLTLDVRHLLTPDMIKDGSVRPVPADIYRYNKGIRDDAYEWDWPEEKIFLNLCEKSTVAAPGGVVRVSSRFYSSDDLKAIARAYENMNRANRKSPSYWVTVYEIPNAPLNLLWLKQDGTIGCLNATNTTKKQFDDDSRGIHDFLTILRNAKKRVAAYQNRKNPKVATVISKDVLSAAKQKKIDDAEKNAHLLDSNETAAEKRRKATAAVATERVGDLLDQFSIGREQAPHGNGDADADTEYASVDNTQKLILDFSEVHVPRVGPLNATGST
ncbi:hypothetical protein PQR65_13390 [Paraburkholderia nemoris]|uniref:hypothetical protein n=1 Tax=Paraburkholderia nemoris TaxID=2793076 RepID=UPI0038B98A1D